jgi:hypothetical protein
MGEFGPGLMILDKVISLECWKNFEIFSFNTHTFMEIYVVTSHYFGYKYAIYKRLTLNSISALNFV